MRPLLSRTIEVTRRARPARDTRATPPMPKRVSTAPLASRRSTAPRGVSAVVRSVPATSSVSDGPPRIATAPIPAPLPGASGTETTPVPLNAGSSAPLGSVRTTV